MHLKTSSRIVPPLNLILSLGVLHLLDLVGKVVLSEPCLEVHAVFKLWR